MIVWLDAQISPDIAPWIRKQFGIETHAVRDLGLTSAKDQQIFMAARHARAVVMSKDSDFLLLLDRYGPPPQVIWLTCGNSSNLRLKEILKLRLKRALRWITDGERLVEISDIRPSVRRRRTP